jgi:hypothetical protein
MSKMKKSSRFWWLHGAILLSAVIGCKNCNSGGSSCAPGGMSGGVPPYGAPVTSGGPVGSAGAMTYSSSAPYTGGTAMPSGSSSFSSGTSAGYPMPNMASSMPQGLGGTR